MVVLSLVSLVDQIDMAILRGVLPILEDEWRLSNFQLGLLGFSFIFINTIATVPAGWVADHYRRNRIIGWTLVSWSGLIVLSATAVNYWNLVFARALMGIGQSVDDPASTSLLGDYYPGRMRSRVFSAQQIAFFVGGGIGLALGGYVGERLGWRWAFALVGIPGSLVAVLAFRLREPMRGESDLRELGVDVSTRTPAPPEATSPEDASLRDFVGRAWSELVSELRMIFGIRTMRYILIGVSALLFTVSGIGFWLAIYHERFSGMSVTESTAFTAAVLGIGGGLGTILGGVVADRSARRGPGGRIALVVWSAIGCAVLFMISFAVAQVPLRLGLQFVGVLSAAGAAPALRAAMMDVIPAESRGVGASAFALAAAVFGTALAPPLVGLLADITGSLVTAFYIVFPPVIIGLLLLLRARTTIVEDAAAIVTSMAQRAQLHSDAPQLGDA
ncbi:MAG TPA: MFS transporter [Acidimicrobiales bacterium]|nr:MFS transporter [Acidimicrobiales bacterium]